MQELRIESAAVNGWSRSGVAEMPVYVKVDAPSSVTSGHAVTLLLYSVHTKARIESGILDSGEDHIRVCSV